MIKKIAKNISKVGASFYGMNDLIKKTGHHLILPFYHSVTDENPVHIKNLYQPRAVEQFKNDIDFLLEHYESISLKELIKKYINVFSLGNFFLALPKFFCVFKV